jgi:hypothetical protein
VLSPILALLFGCGGFARVLASRSELPTGLSLALPNGLVIQDIGEANVGVVRQLLAVL